MIVDLQERIAGMLDSGASLDVIDEVVIEPAPLSTDQKAALWLYAWSRKSSPAARLGGPSVLEAVV